MSQVQTSNSPQNIAFQFEPLMDHQSSEAEYRGTCTYRKNKCSNKRTFTKRSKIHSLCKKHRDLHNRNQRKSDLKQYKRKLTRKHEEMSPERVQHQRMLQNRRSIN